VIYFDHNATSPLCAAAREAWLAAVERFPANPASPHRLGARAEAALDEARQSVAEWLNCSPLDVVWTSGATEANNSVLHDASLDGDGEAWVSAIEHPSGLEAGHCYFGKRLRLIPANRDGTVELDWVEREIKRNRPRLVFVMAANNETGVLQLWRELLRLCRNHQVPFACDAAQWVGKLPAAGLGECDYVTGCAHKFGGPVGVGFIKVPSTFRPLLRGGGQEDGRRAGTQNVPGVLAMIAAWKDRELKLARGERLPRESWRDEFIHRCIDELEGTELVGAGAPRLWNTVSLILPELPSCRRWVVKLDKQGFATSTGSACASGKEKPSHVLKAMEYPDTMASRAVRLSAGWETTESDWANLREGIAAIAEEAGRGASQINRGSQRS
jgi:cysteine desulfurase